MFAIFSQDLVLNFEVV